MVTAPARQEERVTARERRDQAMRKGFVTGPLDAGEFYAEYGYERNGVFPAD